MKPHSQTFTYPMTVGDLRHVVQQLDFAPADTPIAVKTPEREHEPCLGITAGDTAKVGTWEAPLTVAQGHPCPLLERTVQAGAPPCEVCPDWALTAAVG